MDAFPLGNRVQGGSAILTPFLHGDDQTIPRPVQHDGPPTEQVATDQDLAVRCRCCRDNFHAYRVGLADQIISKFHQHKKCIHISRYLRRIVNLAYVDLADTTGLEISDHARMNSCHRGTRIDQTEDDSRPIPDDNRYSDEQIPGRQSERDHQ